MPEYSISKIIQHRFHVNNDIGELGIGYDMTTGRDLMVKLVLLDDLKRQLTFWDGVSAPMK